MSVEHKRFWGKYRAKVIDNEDPMAIGRLLVDAPDFAGKVIGWALPCAPWPGDAGLSVPPAGTNVWLEFEGGDVNYPIWSGCFWTLLDPPVLRRGDD